LSISPQVKVNSNPSKNLGTQAHTPAQAQTPVGKAASKPIRVGGAKSKKPIINGTTLENNYQDKGSFSTSQDA
jgi:hypothetical protein